MSSIFQNFRNQALPVSQTTTDHHHHHHHHHNNKELQKDQQSQSEDHDQDADATAAGGGGGGGGGGLRRRLSSLSLKIQPISSGSPAAAVWAFRRSKSVSEMGEYAGNSVRNWWEWGWGWIMSRKPTFARDLEMNEQESSVLGGCQNKGSWRQVFYKVRSELRKLVGSDNTNVGLPQTTFRRYDHYSSFNGIGNTTSFPPRP